MWNKSSFYTVKMSILQYFTVNKEEEKSYFGQVSSLSATETAIVNKSIEKEMSLSKSRIFDSQTPLFFANSEILLL